MSTVRRGAVEVPTASPDRSGMSPLPTKPFRRNDLPRLGISRAQLRSGIADRSITQLLRGVYMSSAEPVTLEVRAAAALLAITDRHVLVDRTAAWIHGIDSFALPELDGLIPIDAYALRGAAPTKRGGIRSGERDLMPEDVLDIGGAKVTSPLRTALDLGCFLRRREAYAVLNEFARTYGISRSLLRLHVKRYRRRRGVVQLRELVELVDPRIESPRESWVRLAIHDANLPEPVAQHVVSIDGIAYRIDFAYRHARVAVEYDGEEHHSSTADREHDLRRRAAMEARGWRFIVVRSGDFSTGPLEAWTTTLRDCLKPAYTSLRAG